MANCTYCNGTKYATGSGPCQWCNIPYPSATTSELYVCSDLYWNKNEQVEDLCKEHPELETSVRAIASFAGLYRSLNDMVSTLREYPNTEWHRCLPPEFHHLAFGLATHANRQQSLVALRQAAESLVRESHDLDRIMTLLALPSTAVPQSSGAHSGAAAGINKNSKAAPTPMTESASAKLNQTVVRYQEALDYLEQCESWDCEAFVAVHRLAGTKTAESELRSVWASSVANIAPLGGQSGGAEAVREMTRETLKKAISTFAAMELTDPKPASEKASPSTVNSCELDGDVKHAQASPLTSRSNLYTKAKLLTILVFGGTFSIACLLIGWAEFHGFDDGKRLEGSQEIGGWIFTSVGVAAIFVVFGLVVRVLRDASRTKKT